MTRLEEAARRGDWETAALYLLLGLARTAARLPRGDAEDLFALLDGAPARRNDQ